MLRIHIRRPNRRGGAELLKIAIARVEPNRLLIYFDNFRAKSDFRFEARISAFVGVDFEPVRVSHRIDKVDPNHHAGQKSAAGLECLSTEHTSQCKWPIENVEFTECRIRIPNPQDGMELETIGPL